MAAKAQGRSGLGRGLGSLLANTSESNSAGVEAAQTPGRFAELPIGAILPNPRQPREVFDPEALEELIHSIKEIGLLQPVVVRPTGNGAYELVAGERRLRASKTAGLESIPAIIRQTPDADLLRDALLENLHRANLNPLEEAAAYQQLLDDFGCTQDELAQRIGRSRPAVTNALRLLKLPPSVQKRVAAGVLSAGHAKALAGVVDSGQCEVLAAKVVAQGLSVRALEELIALGPGTAQKKPSLRKQQHHPKTDYPEVAAQLAEALDTRVLVLAARGSNAGSIQIAFADQDDLARVVGLLVPRSTEHRAD